MASPSDSIYDAQRRLLNDPQISDITITCGSKTWRCHREILSQRCAFFKAICEGSPKACDSTPAYIARRPQARPRTTSNQESAPRTINLPDNDPNAVDMLLTYIYTLRTPHLNMAMAGHNAISAYHIGDKYNQTPLRDAGKHFILRLIDRIALRWRHADMQSKETEIGTETETKTASVKIDIVSIIGDIWNWDMVDAHELRTAMLETIVKISEGLIEMESFQALLDDNEELRLAVLRALAKKASGNARMG